MVRLPIGRPFRAGSVLNCQATLGLPALRRGMPGDSLASDRDRQCVSDVGSTSPLGNLLESFEIAIETIKRLRVMLLELL